MLRTAPAWLKTLLLGQFVSATGSLAWLYLTLYLVSSRHLSPTNAGLVTATYGVGVIGGSLLGGSIGDRLGLKQTLVGSIAAWVVCCSIFPLTTTALLAPCALLTGVSGSAGGPLMSALIAGAMPSNRRREAIAMSRAARNAGTVIGPPIGGLLAAHHFNLVFLVDAATSFVLLIAVVRSCPATARGVVAGGSRSMVAALRNDRRMMLLVVSVLAVDTTYRLLYTVLPLFLRSHHAPTVLYGLTITVNCFVIVAFEPRIARKLASRPAVKVIAVGYLLVGTGWLVLGAVPVVVGALMAVLIITAGEMLYKPTATALAADLAPPGMQGRYQSIYSAASIGGMLLSPLLGTALYSWAPHLVWPVAGVVALGAAKLLRTASNLPEAVPTARIGKV